MPRRVRGLLVLVLVGPALLLAASPSRAHPFHLQLANEILVGSDEVHLDNWIAQSFVPPSSFVVSRASLFVTDIGASDLLAVSIRASVAGSPATTNLTAGAADGPLAAGWLDLDFSPYVELAAGQAYWIVARSTAVTPNGYEWWDSGDDLAYLAGTGVKSADGITWDPRLRDFSFRIYGFVQPAFSFSSAVSDGTVGPGQSVVFRIDFANSGPGVSAAAWVNVSLPVGLTYVTDDAAAVGGIRSGGYTFTFFNLGPGTYTFNVTAIADGGVLNGTVAVTRITFDATDHNGVLLISQARDMSITFRNARLGLVLAWGPPIVDPGDLVVGNATVTNLGAEGAVDLFVEASVDPNATYVASSPAGIYDGLTRFVRWTAASLGAGGQWSLEWTARVPPGTPDLAALGTSVRVSYKDPTGTALPSEETSAMARVRAPVFAPTMTLDRTSAERGDEVFATFYHNNTGSGPAAAAWANWSLGGHFERVALFPATTVVPTPEGFAVAWTNLSPGSHALVARLRVVRGLADGLALTIRVDWAATDGKGNPLPASVISGASELRAPSVTLSLAAGPRVELGSSFILNLTIRNGGRAAGVGWLNLTLPATVAYLGDDGTYAQGVVGGRVTWFVPNLPANATRTLRVTLRAGGTPDLLSLRFQFNLTDGKGSEPEAAFSNGVAIEFFATPPAAGGLGADWPWFALAGGAGLAAFAWLRRRRASHVTVEDVFVVDRSGLLLAHRSSTLLPSRDEDILVGMLTAVQAFVRDAFSDGTDEPMRSLEFGRRKILIERGLYHYVAVVYRGEDRGELESRVQKVSREIDARFGAVLAQWDGDTEAVEGIGPLLPGILERRPRI